MIRFRSLQADDFPLLTEWLQRPHVKRWWDDGDDSLEKVAAHYGARDGTRRFIAERNGAPIGYFQYYRTQGGEIGCDQFLADAENLSRGLGGQCLSAFVDLIANSEHPSAILVDPHPDNARAILVDPHPDNARAIHCYRKCGFLHEAARSAPSVYCMVKVLHEA